MKKISIEEADKILAAHPPKDTNCPYCGANLVDSHVPIAKIKALVENFENNGKVHGFNMYNYTYSDIIRILKVNLLGVK